MVGRLDITFACCGGGQTVLQRQRASYPFHVCRPHSFPEDPPGMATLYVQSCAGGIYEGDDLHMRIVAKGAAEVQVTSQAPTIVHTMSGHRTASHMVEIEAHPGSYVEYVPDPLIMFPRARLRNGVRVRAARSACVVLADAFVGHDPYDIGESFDWLDTVSSIEDETGAVLVRDRFLAEGAALALKRPGLNGPYLAQGTLIVFGPMRRPPDLVRTLREAAEVLPAAYAGASLLPQDCGAWVRVLASDGAALRAAMDFLWSRTRLALTGRWPVPRRK